MESSEQAFSIASKYCKQLRALNESQCVFPESQNNLCKDLGTARPQWITEDCEIVSTGIGGTLSGVAGEMCKYLVHGVEQSSTGNTACAAPILTTVCNAHVKVGESIGEHLFTEGGFTEEQQKQEVIDGIRSTFVSAGVSCLQAMAKTRLKEALVDRAGTSSARWARFALGRGQSSDILKEAAEGGAGKKFDFKGAAAGIAADVAFAVCEAAATSVADSINRVPPAQYENACGPRTETESQARVASCFRTLGSACSAGSGKIDIAGIVGAEEGGEKITAEVVGQVLEGGCSVAGNVSAAACGVISESVKQIKEAITTGNNSWADCAGTTKMGACLGERWTQWALGVRAGDAQTPVDGWQQERLDVYGNGREFRNYYTKNICRCTQKCYRKKSWARDERFFSSQTYRSISQGSAGRRECQNLMGRTRDVVGEKYRGDPVYYEYEGCQVTKVRSENPNLDLSQGGNVSLQVGSTWSIQYFPGLSIEKCGGNFD